MAPTTEALAALRDIHLPEAVSFWPLAPGWWVVSFTLLVLAGGSYGFVLWRRRSIKRAALRELDAAQRDFSSTGDCSVLATTLSSVLRRVALARFQRSEVAGLHGDDWFGFLASSASGVAFPSDVGASMDRAVYADPDSPSERDGEVWIAAARDWIRRMS